MLLKSWITVTSLASSAIGTRARLYSYTTSELHTNPAGLAPLRRGYQGKNPTSPSDLPRVVPIYLDAGTSKATISGNVIANTANVIENPSMVGSTTAFWLNNGRNDTWSGNVIGLGTTANIADAAWAITSSPNPTFSMTGNVFRQNIFIGNWSGPQAAYLLGAGPDAYFYGGLPPTPSAIDNLYYNYGSGAPATAGNISGGGDDAAPITGVDPQISGTTHVHYRNGQSRLRRAAELPPHCWRLGPSRIHHSRRHRAIFSLMS